MHENSKSFVQFRSYRFSESELQEQSTQLWQTLVAVSKINLFWTPIDLFRCLISVEISPARSKCLRARVCLIWSHNELTALLIYSSLRGSAHFAHFPEYVHFQVFSEINQGLASLVPEELHLVLYFKRLAFPRQSKLHLYHKNVCQMYICKHKQEDSKFWNICMYHFYIYYIIL